MSSEIASAIGLSIQVAVAATALNALFGVPLAYVLARRRFWGKSAVDLLVTLPLVLPPTVTGYYLIVLLGRRGWLGGPLYEATGWSITFTWYAAVVAATVMALPLLVRTARAAIESVDRDLERAAWTLGRSEWRTALEVTLPLARNGLIAGLVLAFARALGEFGATLMLAGNIPGKTATAPLAIYTAVQTGERGRRAAPGRGPHRAVLRGAPGGGAAGPARDMSARLEVRLQKRLPGFALDVEWSAGDGVAVLFGPSGAGKSLTLQCLAGLLRPDAGRVMVDGRVLFDSAAGVDTPPQKRRVGYVFQGYALFPHLSVADNVGFGLRDRPRHERQRRVDEVLAKLGIERPRAAAAGRALRRPAPARGARPRARHRSRAAPARRAAVGAGSSAAAGAPRRAARPSSPTGAPRR